jgi:hypothetical protein
MGKPFTKELDRIEDVLAWALVQNVDHLISELLHDKLLPLFIVGSGGSLSACHYAAILFQQHGVMAKAITPLELFYSKNAIRSSNVLFISASGKNTDILFGYETAISLEPNKVFSICMKKNSALGKLAGNSSISRHYEFDIPSGKDGFLATNSLVAFFVIIYKLFTSDSKSGSFSFPFNNPLPELDTFLNKVSPYYTFNVLYAGLGHPVAIDIESKLVEAALANVIISDYRNFGHGRHHWFAKRKETSALVAIITPKEELIAQKTLFLLPSDIPTLIIRSNYNNNFASIDLLIKSFFLINAIGTLQNIDPGRPGVPSYGSKLYNLSYYSLLKQKKEISDIKRISILRKTKAASLNSLSDDEKEFWYASFEKFKEGFQHVEFGSVIFDYDGTLCSSTHRFNGITEEIYQEIIRILEKGIVVGIATGRGQSVRKDLFDKIPSKYHSNVIIVYYNCSDI